MVALRRTHARCGMCQNRCDVLFEVDGFGLVARARRRRFSGEGEVLSSCPNLSKTEGRSLDRAQRLIERYAGPKYIPTGGH